MNINPIYLDLHIHTSNDANSINSCYDVDTLIAKVKENSLGNEFLISLTDHNTINKQAYLKLKELKVNFLVGVELSIRNYSERPFYHCHIFFDLENKDLEASIDNLNEILDKLYPEKLPSDDNKNIPFVQTILDSFDNYEYLVLPHGGQSHRTFDNSIPTTNVKFDTVMQRATYYNVFDGFTARNNDGLEKTINYFKKLGINEFINLITCSDNYDPNKYPESKDGSRFVKTWMYSEPTFNGLRISLTESNRLEYGNHPTDSYQVCITSACLSNDLIDINVEFTPGLNVVIGNSSSGKTLLVDSVYNKLSKSNNDTYSKYNTKDLIVNNSSNIIPHYFKQNFILENILKIASNDGKIDLSNVSILNKIFKLDDEVQKSINLNLQKLENYLNELLNSAESINQIIDEITKIPNISNCIVFGDAFINPLNIFIPPLAIQNNLQYLESSYKNDLDVLNQLSLRMKKIVISEDITSEIDAIKTKLKTTYDKTSLEAKARAILTTRIKEINDSNSSLSEKDRTSQKHHSLILDLFAKIRAEFDRFYNALNQLASFNFSIKSREISSSGHKLFIENNLSITKQDILNTFNEFLKSEFRFKNFTDICPEGFKTFKFSKKPIVRNIEDLNSKVLANFKELNKTKYRILYKGEKDFDSLSPGIQSSIILDIILGYDKDNAPLINACESMIDEAQFGIKPTSDESNG